MEKLKKARQILGVSISPYLYKKLKEECNGKNVSAFVERAIAKGLEEKEKGRKEFRKKLIADYQVQAKNKKLQKELKAIEEIQFEDLDNE